MQKYFRSMLQLPLDVSVQNIHQSASHAEHQTKELFPHEFLQTKSFPTKIS